MTETSQHDSSNPFKLAWTVASILGTTFGVLSVVQLLRLGFALGFVAPLQAVLDWYVAAVNVVLHPLEPFAAWIVSSLSALLRIKLYLASYWRDVLVLGTLLSGAVLRTKLPPMLKGFAASFGVVSPLGMVVDWLPPEHLRDRETFLSKFGMPVGPVVLVYLLVVFFAILAVVTSIAAVEAGNAVRLGKPYQKPAIDFPAVGQILISVLIVFGGAAVFVAFNAGLKLIGL
jgi:hypothetical protein